MKISKKAYYGLRALVGIAHFGEISAHALAIEENLPEDYLQKILQQLKRAGVISSEKGSAGGYSLAKNAKDISVWEIISTLDGEIVPFAPPKMTSSSPYPKLTHCQTNQVWRVLSQEIESVLSRITLAQLLSQNQNVNIKKQKARNISNFAL